MQQSNYIAVHGHFYQPPRENPWLGRIDKQHSAYPYNDWNERINRECYHPNGFSRILDSMGRVEDIVLNYKYINFNIGPTLLDWIQKHDSTLYKRILQADRESMELFNGHGNAIAQVYNHVIMPLANQQDRITQIEWGIAHFKKHFKRYPEAMWLAETAISYEVVEDLIDYKMKYVILSPTQAQKIKGISAQHWHDVSDNSIDTTRPYRVFIQDGRFLDVIFYNMQISTGISFSHYLRDANRLADKFEQQMHPGRASLVTACTDGESYGHHEHYGDMCLAYLMTRIVQDRGFKIANFADYIEKHVPTYEVALKPGHDGEGTAWSCAHGVGRWYRDCGCSTGGRHGWNQEWRGDLREAFDYLQDNINVLYEQKLNKYFDDVWDVRDKYIEVVLDYSDKKREFFLQKYCKKKLEKDDQDLIFSFLEAQKNLLLMYTSCAWFFADISGIEPVQNMKYALKAIQHVQGYTKKNLQQGFLDILEQGQSNLSKPANGREVFEAYAKPCLFSSDDVVANYAIASMLKYEFEDMDIGQYHLQKKYKNEYSYKGGILYYGEVGLKDNLTGIKEDYKFYVFCGNIKRLKCYVGRSCNINDNKLFSFPTIKGMQSFLKKKSSGTCYDLSCLFLDNAVELIKIAMQDNIDVVEKTVYGLYEKSKNIIDLFVASKVPLPSMIKSLCRHYLTDQINQKIEIIDDAHLDSILADFEYAKKLEFELDRNKIVRKIHEVIEKDLDHIKQKKSIESCDRIIRLLEFNYEIGLELPTYDYEEKVFFMLKDEGLKSKKRFYRRLCEVGEYLNILP